MTRPSLILRSLILVTGMALVASGCDKAPEAQAPAAAARAPDPAAPAPGTQAAEAIGVDDDAPVLPPDKKRH